MLGTYSYKSSYEIERKNAIIDVYSKNLQDEIKVQLEQNGYIAESVNVKIADDDSYAINYISVKIKQRASNGNNKQGQSIVESVKHIIVRVDGGGGKKFITSSDEEKIRKILKENFGVEPSNIDIK